MLPNRNSWILLAFIAALGLGSSASSAPNVCLKAAKGEFRGCLAVAQEGYQTEKDACLNRDHACVEVCRATRSECSGATNVDEALKLCEVKLVGDREICRGNNLPHTSGRDLCVDQAQVIAFQCRDAAREAALSPLRTCRKDFKTCANACAKPVPEVPADTKQCKIDAQDGWALDKAACVEDHQLAKDICKNRDHDCVEACRTARQVCKAPILAVLETDKAECRAIRDPAVESCKTLYAEGTFERDACIDLAQVDAFRCRDDAREVAAPGLQACRQGFRDCVQQPACALPPAP